MNKYAPVLSQQVQESNQSTGLRVPRTYL